MCTFSMTIKTFLLCLCLTACNGNEEVTEAETSSGYPSLLNKTVPVPAEYLEETASQGSVVQIDYDTRNYVDGNGEMRSNTAYVYLPYGYKESSDECYDVFYFVHGHGETAASFFQNENGMMRTKVRILSSSCKDSAINVSHVGFILICRAKFLQNPVLQNYLHTSNQ